VLAIASSVTCQAKSSSALWTRSKATKLSCTDIGAPVLVSTLIKLLRGVMMCQVRRMHGDRIDVNSRS